MPSTGACLCDRASVYSTIASSFHHVEDGRNDVGVGAAAAEVAVEARANLGLGRLGILVQETPSPPSRSRACRSRTARRRGARRPRARDRASRRPGSRRFESSCRRIRRASMRVGADRLAVDEHRAAAAGAVDADRLGAGQVQAVAQHFEQRGARLDFDLLRLAVDVQRDAWSFRPRPSTLAPRLPGPGRRPAPWRRRPLRSP